MKPREFLKNLNKVIKENPEFLEYDVVTSKDAEGNGYNEVHYTPLIGFFEGNGFKSSHWDEEDNKIELEEYNAVCIN